MKRIGALMAVLSAFLLPLPASLIGQNTNTPPASPPYEEKIGIAIPMHDGVHLYTDVYLPLGGGRWPTILVRTPYNRTNAITYRYFVRRGYAVVIQDVRGRWASEGTFGPVSDEGPDGNETINWIARQPWSDGRVAMTGGSYLGIVQWWAAVEHNPHLRAITPVCSGDDEYLDRFYSTGGALKLGHRLLWIAENFTPPSTVRPLFAAYISHLPVRTADEAATGLPLPLWRSALEHPSYDRYWENFSIRERLNNVDTAVQSMGGWFDNYAESDLDAFSRLARDGKTIETWIGPWGHNPGVKFKTRDFGPEAALPIRLKEADWFDRWFKKTPAGEHPEVGPSLHLFVMGPNAWREEHEWPLARTRFTPLYLNSEGHANSAVGNGTLQWNPVRKSSADTFTYDPRNPVATVGGAICCEPVILPPGPLDQSSVEKRPDVLVYTSTPLEEDLEVTGPVRTILYIATSANDSDFTAKLVDVYPDGQPLMVTDGLQRLRYRLSLTQPSFVKRNTTYQISVDTGVTSYVFPAGHRIRVELSSSNFPRFERNLNTMTSIADETKIVKARQTVYHQKGFPSAIILPIIPRAIPAKPETRRQPAPKPVGAI